MCKCGCASGKLGMPCHTPRTNNSAVSMGVRAPDTMRHGGFDFEVRGSDRATSRAAREGSPLVAHTFTNPLTNQAGMLAPHTSPDGERLHGSAATFIREMNPIERHKGFPNNVGVTKMRVARNITVVSAYGFDGILPLSQQPRVAKPLPY